MTIAANIARNDYTGAGSVGPYAYNFKVFAATELDVIRRDSTTGAETQLVYLTDYTVSGAGNTAGGTVTLLTALAVGQSLTIRQNQPLTQTTDIRNAGQYFPETHEDRFDKITLQLQHVNERVSRSLKLSRTNAPSSTDVDITQPVAGKVVTATATGFTLSTLDSSAVALPGASRTVATLSAYLSNNAIANVLDFAPVGVAINTGANDATSAFVAAVAAIPFGGRLKIPSGKYKLTDEITLHAGIIIEGDGSADWTEGAPPAAAAIPSYVFQATAGKACFVIGVGMNAIVFRDMAIGAVLTPTITPTADNKIGIKLSGTVPAGYIWQFTVERVSFFNLHYGIYVNDPNAATGAQDWSIAPAHLLNCSFYYPLIGLYVNTNNADLWEIDGCAFFIPPNGDGVLLNKFGIMKFANSFAGGSSVSANHFVRIIGVGTNAVDRLSFDGCQAETLTQAIKLETTGTYGTLPLVIHVVNCDWECDVYLGNRCRYYSENTRYYNANLYIDHASTKVSSWLDEFQGTATISWLTGTANAGFHDFAPGVDGASGYATDRYVAGRLIRLGTAAPTSGPYKVADSVLQSSPSVGVATGWVCTVAGSPGTWAPLGWILGSSADKGDASVTLVYFSEPTQRFDSALTANRTVTMPANGLCYNGQKFRIVRTGLGAFQLTVQDATPTTLKVIPNSTAAYVDVEFNGTNWKLAGYGTL